MAFFEHYGVDGEESFRTFRCCNLNFPLHFHHAYELIFVNKGKLRVTVDRKEYLLHKNDAIFVFNNQMHELKSLNDSDISIVLFSPEVVGHFFLNFKGQVPENNLIHLNHIPDLNRLDSIYQKKSFLYGICGILVDHTKFIKIDYSTKTKVLHKILIYIDRNFSSDCTLKAITMQLQYDYAYLSKLFVQMTQMTFTEYLNHYRISQACYLLKNSMHSITEIAVECGYNNLRSFNRNFKKITDYSPRNYREYYRDDSPKLTHTIKNN